MKYIAKSLYKLFNRIRRKLKLTKQCEKSIAKWKYITNEYICNKVYEMDLQIYSLNRNTNDKVVYLLMKKISLENFHENGYGLFVAELRKHHISFRQTLISK